MCDFFNAVLNGNTVYIENYINDTCEFLEPLNEEADGNEHVNYMTMLLGTLMHMADTYRLNYSIEKGDEYPYIEITPKMKSSNSLAIIIMIAVKKNDESLINTSKRAINEIRKRKIYQKMVNDGYDPRCIKLYGFGCFKKDCAVRYETAN